MENKSIIYENALVLHLRLGDFIHENNPPEIFDKNAISDILDTLNFSKLYIVCNQIKHDWEKKYIQHFIDKYNTELVSGSILDDFTFLRNAKRLVTSPSTFCWIAAYLGNADEVHIPYSNFYKKDQILEHCHANSKIYYGLPFSTTLLTD